VFEKRDAFLGLRRRPFHEYELPFKKGDLLALYTDGIVEAQNDKGEDYSVQRLNKLIVENAQKPVQELMDLCMEDYTRFRSRDSDDITLLILRKKV
jgi:sigma-B regulation protein RsbU (phosphoserine phosphatase)